MVLVYNKRSMLPGLFCLLFPAFSCADIIKPALVEINANTDGSVNIELRASIEALLTGINAEYKNTQDSPSAKEYDELRVLNPSKLKEKFERFKLTFTDSIYLEADGKKVALAISSVTIPDPGYIKVARVSIINLAGKISPHTKKLVWYYPYKFGDNVVKVKQVDERYQKWRWSDPEWIREDRSSKEFSLSIFAPTPAWKTVLTYIKAGFDHILPKGLDHILFVLGLFLFSAKMRPLLWQITMFTVAHTITLGLSIYQIINLPPTIVEPLIALSIAYVGVENLFMKKLHQHRLFLVFGFGLLHGLGFAGSLWDFGMPEDGFAPALLGFNIGVEFGQLFIVASAFLLVGFWFGQKPWYRIAVCAPASLAICLTGLYWTFERIQLQ